MHDQSGSISIHSSVAEPLDLSVVRPKVPHHATRMIVARLLADILRLSQRGHYPKLRFIQTVEITVILTTIFYAESEGKPFNVLGLSNHLEMPRPTLLRRLAYLESRGTIRREAQCLRMNPVIFATTRQREETLRRLRQIIIDAGNALSKIDTD